METISDYLFRQGVLGFALLLSLIVNIYQQKKNDKKDVRIEELQNLRLDDEKERGTKVITVLQDTSQNMLVLSERIRGKE